MMQKTEYSVPLERLAGNMPFRGLRRPPAVPEVWLPAQCAKGRYLQWLSPLRIFIQRKIKCCFFCFWGMRQPAAVKSRGGAFLSPRCISLPVPCRFRGISRCARKNLRAQRKRFYTARSAGDFRLQQNSAPPAFHGSGLPHAPTTDKTAFNFALDEIAKR